MNEVILAIVELIKALQDEDNNPYFRPEAVVRRETNTFEADPSCTVVKKESPAEETTNLMNEVKDTYQIKVYVSITGRDLQQAWDTAEKLQLAIAKALDTSCYLDGAAGILHPAQLLDMIEPQTATGGHVIAELSVMDTRLADAVVE